MGARLSMPAAQATRQPKALDTDPDRAGSHLREDERHRSQTGQGTDVVFADFSTTILEHADDVRQDAQEAVVFARGESSVLRWRLEAYLGFWKMFNCWQHDP